MNEIQDREFLIFCIELQSRKILKRLNRLSESYKTN